TRKSTEAKIKSLTGSSGKTPQVQTYTNKKAKTLQWGEEIYSGYSLDGVDATAQDKIQFLNYNGKNYFLVLESSELSTEMPIKNAYVLENDRWIDGNSIKSENLVFSYSKDSCSNKWPDGKAQISYYESGNDRGLPAIVPFNLREGWFAMVPNSGGTFLEDSPKGYTASGDVSYFKICNIGKNQLMESGTGDDLCQTFDVNTAGSVDKFLPCSSLCSDKVRDLYVKAREAIRQASQQKEACASGSRNYVTILGNQRLECGPPMSKVTGFECQDFMSPQDCKLMFNVCDPVICPPSRCNLGGKMPVSDVIQTGIIGSLVLCLPNINEGIVVPVCVSGVAAGIDSFVSILQAEKECLQRSVETGEHVGICDEITSIYMCEFFWRQLSPVLDMLVPRIVESLYTGSSQRTRGGGEYMLVQNAWDNTQKSIDYFKNTYAPNAFKIFRIKNIQEAGSEVCKAFIGTSFPASAKAIDSLLEPESPSQFYAQFSEILFTEATVPSTSQYKVYYHIYAGKDIGTQYRVYLKSPPEYSYYAANPIINVKTGYIAKGDYADETVDFTAPSGYRELCVVINAREECGFKQVSSSLAIDYLSNKYVQEQAEKVGITTEKECISGSPSALSMANLNIQQGIEQSVTPEIALNGIVRVCASKNPEEGVDKTNRWKDVGFCGDETLRCWLDIQSVRDDLKKIEAVENTSISLLDKQKGLLNEEKVSLETVKEILSKSRQDIKELKSSELKQGKSSSAIKNIITELDKIIGETAKSTGSGTNADRAEALALKATVYRMIVLQLHEAKALPATGGIEPECSKEKPCETGVCVNGECVQCKDNADCDDGQTCKNDECVGEIEIQTGECKRDTPIQLVYGEQSNDIWIKYDSVSKKWKYSLTNKNDYLAISPTIKIKFGDVNLSNFSNKNFESGCELIEKISQETAPVQPTRTQTAIQSTILLQSEFQKMAEENPKNFTYKVVYQDRYAFYRYNENSEEKWQLAFSKNKDADVSGLTWGSGQADMYSFELDSWQTAIGGLNLLKEKYSEIFYIKR
ncbi:MAG: hypothetical protein Q8N88_04520, partial [Nanoarchaeota archaeon]|nr:hypothetical protein [Nanoarchaeota archaeon]